MKKKQFPKIYRFITESYILTIFLLSFFLVVFVLVGFHLLFSIQRMSELNSQRREIISQIYYWQKVIEEHKNYRDGYYQLAFLEYRLKDIEKAKIYLAEVFRLDPNFEKGRDLEKVLNY